MDSAKDSVVDQVREQTQELAGDVIEQTRATVRNLSEQASAAIADPGATAKELARRTREQAAMASDALYQQGTRAGEYLTRNVNEYPLAALLIAGAVGYGLAYLIHARGSAWLAGRDTLTRRTTPADRSLYRPSLF